MSWPFVTLVDHVEKIGSGITPRGGESVYVSSGTALIRSQNIYNNTFQTSGLAYISEDQAERMRGVTVLSDDVLLNITGDSVARCCLVPDQYLPARVNQHVAIIRPKREEIDPRFLMYFLTSNFMQATMLSLAGSGGTRKALTKGMIENFAVPRPDISTQGAIVAHLSQYDYLIDNNRRRIEILEQSARELYREWFVRFRFPGHEHVKIIDGVPDGWTEGTVHDFYQTSSGGTPSRKRPEYFTGDINWVKTQELHNSYIFDTDERITEEAVSNSSAKVYPRNTVLVAMYGATIGQTGILTSSGCSNQACCALIPKVNGTSSIHAFLFVLENKDGLINLGQGAAQKNISQTVIKKYPMLLPDGSLMEQFLLNLSPVFKQIENLSAQVIQLCKARDLLLPRLMSGKIAA